MRRRSSLRTLALGALLAIPATQALASGPQGYLIRNKQTGEYLAAQGAYDSVQWNNQPVRSIRWPGHRHASIVWHFEQQPGHQRPTRYWIWNDAAGRVLDAHPGNWMATTHPRVRHASTSQTWHFDNGRLKSGLGQCLDAYVIDGRASSTIGIWHCHDGNNQQWEIIR
jgi:hypothetical protein